MKILFTSVGRRVELLQAFRNAADALGKELFLYGTDVSDTAPALMFCDKTFIVPPIKSADYIHSLLEICESNGIRALIPTIDTDLLVLAQNRERFRSIGTSVFISTPDKIKVCRDKRNSMKFFCSCGLKTPEIVDNVNQYDLGFPAFIKPKDGSSSINAFKVENAEELKDCAARIPEYIIQPYIDGTEFTVDAFCGEDGEPILITPRIRLAVRAGEVQKTEIRQDETIIKEMLKLLSSFRPYGAITVQLIRDTRTGEDWFIEINPRFGGGAPLSMKSGADSAAIMIRLLEGEKFGYMPNAAEDGALFARFDQSVRMN